MESKKDIKNTKENNILGLSFRFPQLVYFFLNKEGKEKKYDFNYLINKSKINLMRIFSNNKDNNFIFPIDDDNRAVKERIGKYYKERNEENDENKNIYPPNMNNKININNEKMTNNYFNSLNYENDPGNESGCEDEKKKLLQII